MSAFLTLSAKSPRKTRAKTKVKILRVLFTLLSYGQTIRLRSAKFRPPNARAADGGDAATGPATRMRAISISPPGGTQAGPSNSVSKSRKKPCRQVEAMGERSPLRSRRAASLSFPSAERTYRQTQPPSGSATQYSLTPPRS